MRINFTRKAQEAIELSKQSAVELGHDYVGSEHLLLGLIRTGDSVAAKALEMQNITADDIVTKISEFIGVAAGTINLPSDFTPRTKRILEKSLQEALNMATNYIGTEHILLALIKEEDCVAVKILESLEVNGGKLYDDIMRMLGETGTENNAMPMSGKSGKRRKTNTPTLSKFSRDLKIIASENKF